MTATILMDVPSLTKMLVLTISGNSLPEEVYKNGTFPVKAPLG